MKQYHLIKSFIAKIGILPTEEPEWMSESVQMGKLVELSGFDDSPEKEDTSSDGDSKSNISTIGKDKKSLKNFKSKVR